MHLLTSGCSFTAYPQCWPYRLSEQLDCKLTNLGVGQSSNEMIARRIVHTLETNDFNLEELLVGIMWSGSDRICFFDNNDTIRYTDDVNPEFFPNYDIHYGKFYNVNFLTSTSKRGYFRTWWKLYYNSVHCEMKTVETIIYLQNYLKLKNVKYFMTAYLPDWGMGNTEENLYLDPLVSLVDKNYWLPVESQGDWLLKNDKEYKRVFKAGGDHHPTQEQHNLFTQEVIIPFLKQKEWLDE